MDDVTRLPLSDVVEPRILLRMVDKKSLAYMELRDSIRDRGVLNSILVRPSTRDTAKYEVVDGMYRYSCAVELRLDSIPCIIKEFSDEEMLAIQIQTNALRPETTPIEYARQLKRILDACPGLSMRALAVMVHKSPTWINQMLNLLTLSGPVQKAVERGEIELSKAYMLAKLPIIFQAEFADRVKTTDTRTFVAEVSQFIKKYREQVRQGKLEKQFLMAFEPVAHIRTLPTLQHEYETLTQAAKNLAVANCKTPLDGWRLALQWALNLDPDSVEEQRLAAEAREHKRLLPPGETNEIVK